MKLKDLKDKNDLFQSLDKSILKTITQKETSKQLWNSMKMKCQGNVRVKRAQLNRLRRDFEGYGGRGRGKNAFRGGRGQGRGRGRLNWSKDTVECYKCHKLGHFQYECQANYENLDESEDMVLMVYTNTLGGDRDDVWFIDFGCSNHMCGYSSLFCNLEKGFNKVVRLGNYASMNLVRKGSVRLTVKGVNHLVRDVYYVPELKNNLISVGQMQERGLVVLVRSNMCRIYHHTKGLIIKTTMAASRMFMLLSNTRSVKKERDGECFQDVIFEEEQWNWEMSFQDDRRFYLEWEDGNGEDVEDSNNGSEEENVASPVRDEFSDDNEEDEVAPPMTPQVRRAPTYLNDFVSGDGLSDEREEVQTHLALFASAVHSDPILLRVVT
ncbi:hypothetical protein KIW84_064915 [Lathyrus oleraceus]|uniref:CCHC-type domain-containing protein n=1 Tax=Pisum sativum TaxID=3888 RepID=A0A9D4WDK0_PEA|nr:hypothetical protein KIW84_064915 [Pisum sativum]